MRAWKEWRNERGGQRTIPGGRHQVEGKKTGETNSP
jgi:hypothetical protein